MVAEHQATFVGMVDEAGVEAVALDVVVEKRVQLAAGSQAPKDRNQPPEERCLKEGMDINHPNLRLTLDRQ